MNLLGSVPWFTAMDLMYPAGRAALMIISSSMSPAKPDRAATAGGAGGATGATVGSGTLGAVGAA